MKYFLLISMTKFLVDNGLALQMSVVPFVTIMVRFCKFATGHLDDG